MPLRQQPTKPLDVPTFAEYEELAKVPTSHRWIFRRGPHIRILVYLLLAVVLGFLKLSDSFLGAYGNWAFRILGVGALILILWRYFRRDPTEGVGVKLN